MCVDNVHTCMQLLWTVPRWTQIKGCHQEFCQLPCCTRPNSLLVFYWSVRLVRSMLAFCSSSSVHMPNNTLRTPWSWQKYCLNHCARTCCSLRNVTRCRFTNWRIRCERGGRNVHFLSINLISFRRSRGIVWLNSTCFEVGLIRTVIDNVTGSQRAA